MCNLKIANENSTPDDENDTACQPYLGMLKRRKHVIFNTGSDYRCREEITVAKSRCLDT